MLDHSVTVSISAQSRHQAKRAAQLADDLGFDFINTGEPPPGYVLFVSQERIELHSSSSPPAHGPVFVDFVDGKSAHRRLFGGGRNQHLARAVGMKPGYNPKVIDATAGFGADAFVLASLGCRVHMIERCAAIAQLLEDGILRARGDTDIGPIARRMLLHNGDAIKHIPTLSKRHEADVVYLDPMYPTRTKSAAVKKEMQVLQALTKNHPNNIELLDCALAHAKKRVVVKRPVNAPQLNDAQPQACVKSANTRYDIYVPVG
ncbi:MAG: class I SAM-dependent methyltransferase [Pseudomonadota bacterium]